MRPTTIDRTTAVGLRFQLQTAQACVRMPASNTTTLHAIQSPSADEFRTRRTSSLLKKVFEVSRWATLIQDPFATHERFTTISLGIRILRIARPILSFSANC